MKRIDALHDVLAAYGLTHDMPVSARAAMRDSQKEVLSAILKNKGRLTLLVSLAVGFQFLLKKLGIGITLAKSALAVSAAAIGATIVISGTAVYTIHKVVLAPIVEESANPHEGTDSRDREKKSLEFIHPPFDLGIMPFESDASVSREAARVSLGIAQLTLRLKGPDHAAFMANPTAFAKPRRALTGTVVKLGSIFRISVKLIDNASSQVVFFTSENANGEADIDRACAAIMARMEGKL
ncbi:MAG: hypothetical protein EPN93_21435 [Spirochaetes bacterium]|nr:MAG: hypothetical protein EPN93_21435 [Spirochaetota bacterium]